MRRPTLFALTLLSSSAGILAVDYSREVLPILSDNCFQCHGPDEKARKGDLRLDTREGSLSAIKPGKSAESELIRRVTSTDPEEVMPPPKAKKTLRPEQIATLRGWIDQGAGWGKHWAWEKPVRAALPEIRRRNWPATPIDRFLLARLEREGLTPREQASREALHRRLSLDLRGLPPSLEEQASFLADDSPNSFERLADRLLASPRFGERMAWDWLDAARYADSNGYQGDGERTMWPWRDWVVAAFNRNLPFDEFSRWQLAGDLLPQATEEQRLATGFCRNHMINGEGGRIPAENRVDYVMDMTETAGTVWLGLTLNCCRCHDHKFDALTQRDYYQLSAYFNQTPVDGSGGNPQTPPVLEAATEEQRRRQAELKHVASVAAEDVARLEKAKTSDLAAMPKDLKIAAEIPPEKRDAKRLDQLIAHWKERDAEYARALENLRGAMNRKAEHANSIPRVMVMEDRKEPRQTFILFKGLYDKPTAKVGFGVPASLGTLPASAPSNRLGMADWMLSPDNPLTARVIVNRFWQQFFGLGLVKTAEDFGVQGEKPFHPELLDWLATEFVASGWDAKRLVQCFVTSAAYRQSSRADAVLFERDPENRLLARGVRHRLPAWMLRDQALAAAGLLVGQIGGRPVNPYQPSGVWEETTFGNKRYTQDHGPNLYRRSLYTFWRRIVAPTLFFDNASRQTCGVKQARTNTPLHSLTTLNDVTYVEAARFLAESAMLATGDDRARLSHVFLRTLCRAPAAEEETRLLAAVERHRATFTADPQAAARLLSIGEAPRDFRLPAADHAAWTVVCGVVLNLDEALSKE